MNFIFAVSAIGFWLSATAIVYTYAGYALCLSFVARRFGRRNEPPPITGELPTVTLLVAARNEESCIGARIKNALEQDYPPELLDCVVASDGSTDGTNARVEEFASPRVRLVAYQENRGKAAVLSATVPLLKADVIVFSDANTRFEPNAIRCLVRWLEDPTIAVVSGKLVLHDPVTGGNVDGMYWRYETLLKVGEGRLGATLGANGAIYAIRRTCFVPPPPGTIIDDFVIPLLIRLRHGGDLVFDASAVAHEDSADGLEAEFRRRARIGAGAYQALAFLAGLLHPRQGWLAWCFFSHKLLRWAVPFLLIIMFATNLLMAGHPGYRVLLALQVTGYLAAAGGAFADGPGLPSRLLRLAQMFVQMNAALLVGFQRWLRGSHSGIWEPTARRASDD